MFKGLGLRVQGSRVQGSGFRVLGLELSVRARKSATNLSAGRVHGFSAVYGSRDRV